MTTRSLRRRCGLALLAAVALAAVPDASAEPGAEVTLFRIVTVRDEIVIGVTPAESAVLGGHEAPDLARALAAKGTLEVWRYAVTRGANGLVNAPLARVGVLAHDTLRVEPYATPLPIIPPHADGGR